MSTKPSLFVVLPSRENARRVGRTSPTGSRKPRSTAYILLETVIATSLLLLGLAVIGGQLQESNKAVRTMHLRLRAMMLAEMQLAEMDLGLIELDSVDAVQEEDFGPRFRDWGWRLTIEETAVEKMYLLRADVLYAPREDYDGEEFDFDHADVLYTLYAMRATPQPLDLSTEFGLTEEQSLDLTEKLATIGGGLDAAKFDPAMLAKMPFEELVEVLPPLLQAFGVPMEEITQMLPADLREQLQAAGLLGGEESGGNEQANPDSGGQGGVDENPPGADEVDE